MENLIKVISKRYNVEEYKYYDQESVYQEADLIAYVNSMEELKLLEGKEKFKDLLFHTLN